MDYEQKIKEYLNSDIDVLYKNMLLNLFPELKESEDERIRNFLHHTFTAEYLSEDKLSKWHGEPVANILAWLEKQSEQKPATWSKEDERILYSIIADIKATLSTCTNSLNDYHKEQITWLKSLKPQHHWIPTKRQMECFEDFLLHIPSTNPNKMCLVGIYEELKNLT